jgi:putative CocE/NonD family hydrolase
MFTEKVSKWFLRKWGAWLACLILLTWLLLPSCGHAQNATSYSDASSDTPAPYKPAALYQGFIRFSLYITMRDGVKIAIDLTLPQGVKESEKLPAILHQARYWRAPGLRPLASLLIDDFQAQGRIGALKKIFIAQGYAWVDMDVRGSGASYGSRPYEWTTAEIQDGAQVVDWIVSQTWSNGKVGATGISYDGTAAELLLVNKHPAVKAVAPLFSLFDVYTDIAFPGGVHLSWFTENWGRLNKILDQNILPPGFEQYKALVTGVRPVDEDRDGSLLTCAIRDHSTNWDVHREALKIVYRDDTSSSKAIPTIDVFSPHSFLKEIEASRAAVYSFSGWFDGAYQHAAIKLYLARPNASSRLIIGPWNHGGEENISPFSMGASRFDWSGELLKFFDYYLKDIDTGITREKRIHYYTMGEEKWKQTDTWPPTNSTIPFYINSDNRLTIEKPSAEKATDIYQVDYTAGTGNVTRWDSLLGTSLIKAYPDRADRDRKLLCYTSSPLPRDTEVTGHPIITLFISSDSTDASVFVYLEDVDETGHVTYVTEGVLRALHRKLSDKPPPYPDVTPYRSFKRIDSKLLVPNQIAALTFDLLPTSYLFKQGHRLRIASSGADRDHFAVNYHTAPKVQFYRDKSYTSHLDLPVIKKN